MMRKNGKTLSFLTQVRGNMSHHKGKWNVCIKPFYMRVELFHLSLQIV